MSDERSARLALPLLQPGQAQKEADHNEALALLDIATQPVVQAIGIDTPPAAPGEGECWILGASPVGAWAGHARALAGWTAGGWRFVAPRSGFTVWSLADAVTARHDAGAWIVGDVRAAKLTIAGNQVVGARAAGIASPVGGATIDAEARAAVSAILAALRGHGLIAP